MAQNNTDNHPFPFMQLQNPNPRVTETPVSTPVSLPARNLQKTSGVQNLVCDMEALNLSNPYGFHDYYWSKHRIIDDFAMRRMRIIDAANQVQRHHHHHNVASILGSLGYEEFVWSPANHYLDFEQSHLERWVSMAKDPRGSRVLQKKLDTAAPQEICKILKELRGHLHDLMKHHFGYYVILKIIQSRNISVNKIEDIIFLIVKDLQKFKDVCMDDQGNRAVQKMFESIIEKTLEDENPRVLQIITNSMRLITVPLMKNFNGGHVIQKYLNLFPSVHKDVILDVVAKNFVDIASDKSGCCTVQKCMELAQTQSLLQLINKLISNIVFLAENAYGNFVVQFLIKHEMLDINKMIISLLRNKYVRLSKNKHASNVVEALFKFSEIEDVTVIVHELMDSPQFFYLLVHPYGNYVVQRALEYTQGPLHANLYTIIVSNYRNLSSCLHGKKVLAFANQCRLRGFHDGI